MMLMPVTSALQPSKPHPVWVANDDLRRDLSARRSGGDMGDVGIQLVSYAVAVLVAVRVILARGQSGGS